MFWYSQMWEFATLVVLKYMTCKDVTLCSIGLWNVEWEELQRLLTCDHSGVVLSAGDTLDANVTKALQRFWQSRFEQKRAVAQLAVLTSAERVHVILWDGEIDTTLRWCCVFFHI